MATKIAMIDWGRYIDEEYNCDFKLERCKDPHL